MNLKPLGGNVILKQIEAETTTSMGIIIPDTASKERPERGEVVAVGPGAFSENGQRQPVEVAIGQVVIFKKYSPDEVEVEGQKFLVISGADILAVLEK